MSKLQADRYAEAREHLQKLDRVGHLLTTYRDESFAVRDAFANWYMLSDWDDPKPAWHFYQRQVLERGASLVETAQWTRLAEIDKVAAMRDISRAEAILLIVNHALSDGAAQEIIELGNRK